MSTPLVSFIVPVFNAAKYLEQCLNSLLNQSIENIEVVVIDDGSTDGSVEICNALAASDSRLRFLYGGHQGAGAARNRGLDGARGEYVIFIDADDWVEPDLAALALKFRGADMIYFGYVEHREDCLLECRIDPSGDFSSEIDIALTRLFISSERFFGFTWNKAFRREIIERNHLRFNPDLIIKEDEDFCVRFSNKICTLYLSDETPYNYRILTTSLSHRRMTDRRLTLLAEHIEADAAECPWKNLRQSLLAAAYVYHLDGFRDSYGESFKEWDDFVKRNHAQLPVSNSLRLFDIPVKGLRKLALKAAYTSPTVQRIKKLIKRN